MKTPKKEDPTEQLVKVVNKQEKLINKLVNTVRGMRGERVKDEEEEPGHRDTEEKQPDTPKKNNSNNDGGADEEKRGE